MIGLLLRFRNPDRVHFLFLAAVMLSGACFGVFTVAVQDFMSSGNIDDCVPSYAFLFAKTTLDSECLDSMGQTSCFASLMGSNLVGGFLTDLTKENMSNLLKKLRPFEPSFGIAFYKPLYLEFAPTGRIEPTEKIFYASFPLLDQGSDEALAQLITRFSGTECRAERYSSVGSVVIRSLYLTQDSYFYAQVDDIFIFSKSVDAVRSAVGSAVSSHTLATAQGYSSIGGSFASASDGAQHVQFYADFSPSVAPEISPDSLGDPVSILSFLLLKAAGKAFVGQKRVAGSVAFEKSGVISMSTMSASTPYLDSVGAIDSFKFDNLQAGSVVLLRQGVMNGATLWKDMLASEGSTTELQAIDDSVKEFEALSGMRFEDMLAKIGPEWGLFVYDDPVLDKSVKPKYVLPHLLFAVEMSDPAFFMNILDKSIADLQSSNSNLAWRVERSDYMNAKVIRFVIDPPRNYLGELFDPAICFMDGVFLASSHYPSLLNSIKMLNTEFTPTWPNFFDHKGSADYLYINIDLALRLLDKNRVNIAETLALNSIEADVIRKVDAELAALYTPEFVSSRKAEIDLRLKWTAPANEYAADASALVDKEFSVERIEHRASRVNAEMKKLYDSYVIPKEIAAMEAKVSKLLGTFSVFSSFSLKSLVDDGFVYGDGFFLMGY